MILGFLSPRHSMPSLSCRWHKTENPTLKNMLAQRRKSPQLDIKTGDMTLTTISKLLKCEKQILVVCVKPIQSSQIRDVSTRKPNDLRNNRYQNEKLD